MPKRFDKPKVQEAICLRLACGESLRKICEDKDMPSRETVFQWLYEESGVDGGFPDQYARAREAQQEHFAEEIIEIADESGVDVELTENGAKINGDAIQRANLRIETRKWIMARMAPRKWGNKSQLDVKADVTHATKEQRDAAVAAATAGGGT